MTDNPLSLPIPTDPIERVHGLARDLAYGAANKLWSTTIIADFTGGRLNEEYVGLWGGDDLVNLVQNKWGDARPPLDLLTAFGYVDAGDAGSGEQNYTLTQKAFALLDRPITPPSVFISYHRKPSSTFGLLIECRLKSVGIHAFIDRSLDSGEEWHQQL